MLHIKKSVISAGFAAALLLLSSACLGPDDKEKGEDTPPPSITYATPVTDTVSAAVSHAVSSTGGTVTRYAVSPALPAGLALDTATGLIGGVPLAAHATATWSVIAVGPGGADTATLQITVVLPQAPEIAYAEVYDTSTYRTTYTVLSTGGPILAYTTEPELPDDVSLNPVTGRIVDSTGDQETFSTYQVIAIGPGGSDTTEIEIAEETYPTDHQAYLTLSMRFGGSSQFIGGLAKASAAAYERMVITLTSSEGTDSVIRDTVMASDSTEDGFPSSGEVQMLMSYILKPLRSWTVSVKVLDVNDSLVYSGNAVANNLLVGETRNIFMNLSARYADYLLLFAVPDSIAASGSQKQGLRINRMVLVVDGDTVRDTTSSGGRFSPDPDVHFVEWEYLRTGGAARDIEVYAYADSLGTWNKALPVYGGSLQVSSTDSIYEAELFWMGPGTSFDPNFNPGNPGPAQESLVAAFAPRSEVDLDPGTGGNPLPKGGAAEDRRRFRLKSR